MSSNCCFSFFPLCIFLGLGLAAGHTCHQCSGKWSLSSKGQVYVCCSSVAKLCLTLGDPMDCRRPGSSVLHSLPEFAQIHIHLVMPSNHLMLCRPLLLLPSIFPIIRVFSNELAVRIRWPKFWSFSFSISAFNEYSGLISFRIDWFDFLAV